MVEKIKQIIDVVQAKNILIQTHVVNWPIWAFWALEVTFALLVIGFVFRKTKKLLFTKD